MRDLNTRGFLCDEGLSELERLLGVAESSQPLLPKLPRMVSYAATPGGKPLKLRSVLQVAEGAGQHAEEVPLRPHGAAAALATIP